MDNESPLCVPKDILHQLPYGKLIQESWEDGDYELLHRNIDNTCDNILRSFSEMNPTNINQVQTLKDQAFWIVKLRDQACRYFWYA